MGSEAEEVAPRLVGRLAFGDVVRLVAGSRLVTLGLVEGVELVLAQRSDAGACRCAYSSVLISGRYHVNHSPSRKWDHQSAPGGAIVTPLGVKLS